MSAAVMLDARTALTPQDRAPSSMSEEPAAFGNVLSEAMTGPATPPPGHAGLWAAGSTEAPTPLTADVGDPGAATQSPGAVGAATSTGTCVPSAQVLLAATGPPGPPPLGAHTSTGPPGESPQGAPVEGHLPVDAASKGTGEPDREKNPVATCGTPAVQAERQPGVMLVAPSPVAGVGPSSSGSASPASAPSAGGGPLLDNRGEHAANLSPPDDGVESPSTPVGRVPTTGHVPPRAGESSAVYPSPDLATRSVVLSDADATTDGTRSDGVAALAGRLQALREKAEPLRQGALTEAAATQPARPDRALLVAIDPMVASGSAALLRDLILRAAVVRAAAEQLPMQAALGPPAAHVSTEAPADAEAPPAPGAASSQGSAATQTASGQTSTATLRPSDVATRLDTTASAAPEPPPPARPPSTAERAAVVQQVLARIEALNLLRGPQGFSIQLYPEHLGEIRVRVVAEADRVAARIVAETAAAKVAIEADRDLLRSSLEQRGFTLTGLDVALHQGERDAHLPTEGPARWASLARPRDAAPSAVPSASGPSVPAGRPVREDGRIDYRA